MVDLITASLMVLPLVLCSDHNACSQHGSFCCGHGVHAKNRCWRWPLWFRPCPTLKQESPVDHGTDGAAARTAVVPLCSLFRWDTTMHLHCWSSAHMQLFYIIPISRHLEIFTPLEDEVLLYCLVTLINCPDWWRKLFGTWGWGGLIDLWWETDQQLCGNMDALYKGDAVISITSLLLCSQSPPPLPPSALITISESADYFKCVT